eukprot:TRINITY_DN17366_c0_g1_i1.p1 TRINITY_DN17366_c0_g1~~TRINITY_DN17366_c0_g1_i1.p1  ORF type:complete len:187 (+),score=25.50 TRINITY_DN17366_c0_g1_i1:74-634(+)
MSYPGGETSDFQNKKSMFNRKRAPPFFSGNPETEERYPRVETRTHHSFASSASSAASSAEATSDNFTFKNILNNAQQFERLTKSPLSKIEAFLHSETFFRLKEHYNAAIAKDSRITYLVSVVFALLVLYLLYGALWFIWKVIVLAFVVYSTFYVVNTSVFVAEEPMRTYVFVFYGLVLLYLIPQLL